LRPFALTVFLSAFLLFAVQPVLGKYILPWFGSTPGVWTTCLLFFQILLLAGYAYAHLIVSRLIPRRQVTTHLVLLGIALLLLPITPSDAWKPAAGDDPTLRILLLLLASVGGPFFLLASTGPLLQAWFARLHPDRSPYRLYALSNLGSFLALITYPLVFERFLELEQQTVGWSIAWVLYGVAVTVCASRVFRSPAAAMRARRTGEGGAAAEVPRPAPAVIAMWIGLAACASGLLMATTNRLCLDVAVFPLLWILPLGLYLLTFVICFDRDGWYVRPLFCTLLPLALAGACYSLNGGTELSAPAQVGAGVFALFICCMCCHGELVRLKPDARHLTLFYLAISAGGALGGLLVAVVAPAVLSGFWEFHALLVLSYVLVFVAVARDLTRKKDPEASRRIGVGPALAWTGFIGVVVGLIVIYLDPAEWPGLDTSQPPDPRVVRLVGNSVFVLVAIPFLVFLGLSGPRFWRRANLVRWKSGRRLVGAALMTAGLAGSVPLLGMLSADVIRYRNKVVAQERNFYGVLRVRHYYQNSERHDMTLYHGQIQHGFQLQGRRYRGWPTSYYGPDSGIGVAIRFHPERSRRGRRFRIGVVGLGTGTIAAYANADVLRRGPKGPWVAPVKRQPGDHVVFYEINPQVEAWSRKFFTFRADAERRGAKVDCHLGDARIVMERQLEQGQEQGFDVLAIDAFSSDAIPVHLLTSECFEIYRDHLREGGILAYHVTNRHLALTPVIRRLAKEYDFSAIYVENEDDDEHGVDTSDWVLVTQNPVFIHDPRVTEARKEWPVTGPFWTDDYSSIISVLKAD